MKSGSHESANEVVRDGLRALQERERVVGKSWSDVRQKVAQARREVAEGKTVDGEQAMDEILAELSVPASSGAGKGPRPRSRRGSVEMRYRLTEAANRLRFRYASAALAVAAG